MNRIKRIGIGWGGLCLLAVGLAGCSSPAPQFTDEEWISHSATGRGNFERGDFRRASDAYARAEQRARAMDAADALAVSAVNRAVCLMAAGKPEAALSGVEEALADSRVSADRRTELLVTAARIELDLAHPENAAAHADAVLEMKPLPSVRAQALLARSAAELALGDPARAAATLTTGLPAKAWNQLPAALQAEHSVRRAEIDAAENRPAEAAARQKTAAALWRKADRLPEMARALAAAGRLNQSSGNLQAACDQLYRAARSQWAQGFRTGATRTLKDAVACAEEWGEPDAIRRMAELTVTFQEELRPVEQEATGE